MEKQLTKKYRLLSTEQTVTVPAVVHRLVNDFIKKTEARDNLIYVNHTQLISHHKIIIYLQLYQNAKEEEQEILRDILYLMGCDYHLDYARLKGLSNEKEAFYKERQEEIRELYLPLETMLSIIYLATG